MTWLAVALGAGAGAAARHLLDQAVTRGRFPTGILLVNLLGSLLAGLGLRGRLGPGVVRARLLAVGAAVGRRAGFTRLARPARRPHPG